MALREFNSVKVGDKLAFRGHTTDFDDVVERIEVNNQAVDAAADGDKVGVKTSETARPNDKVYKIIEE